MSLEWQTEFAPISRSTLALYAGASGDHNPVHIDSDAARTAGFDDVFAQGMLGMAYLGRLLTDNVPSDRIRSLSARFVSITEVGDMLTGTGREGELFVENGEKRARIDLQLVNQRGKIRLAGQAVVAL